MDSKFPSASSPPVPTTRLRQICNDACFAALEKVDVYEHSRTESWNTSIINHILRALISESVPSTTTLPSSPPSSPFKFAVNSTIIQHLTSRQTHSSSSTGIGEEITGSELVSGRGGTESGGAGRRGMHSACGAYWNNERDGMWSFKYETKGMDVVVSIIWIAV